MMDGPLRAPSSPPRDAGADEEEALALQVLGAADGVREVGVAAVDDQVARLQVGQQLSR